MKTVILSLILCLPILSGCGALGLATPKGFDQQLSEAYGVYTAVVSATATAVTAGTLNSAEGEAVSNQAKSVRSMLDAAKVAEGLGNAAGASNDLALATQALTSLQSYLNKQNTGVK